MSTRKIMNAKDLSTNKLIYFRGHAKATYMSDGITTVEDAINSIGNISIAYPQVNHGTSDTRFALTPNVLHVWDEVAELSLKLTDPTDTTVANEYIFQFTSGATATTLTLPVDLQWTSEPVINPNCTYQVSILNNCATLLEFAPLP